jgi:hypothetical protein
MPEILEVSTEPTIEAKTPAPVTEPTGWMTPTGEIREGAPETVQTLLEAKKWSKVEDIVNGYLELEKFKGVGEHLVIPEAEDAEGWDDIYSKLGRPETHDQYEFNAPEGTELSEDLIGSFKQFAHGLGLTQKQFDNIVSFQLDAVTAQSTEYDQQLEQQKLQNVQALKEKWGEANFETKIKGAKIIADSLGIYQTLEDKGLASDPEIIVMLDSIASKTSEDVITPPNRQPVQKSATEELDEIKKSESFLNKFDANHKTTMARYMELCQVLANTGQSRAPKS